MEGGQFHPLVSQSHDFPVIQTHNWRSRAVHEDLTFLSTISITATLSPPQRHPINEPLPSGSWFDEPHEGVEMFGILNFDPSKLTVLDRHHDTIRIEYDTAISPPRMIQPYRIVGAPNVAVIRDQEAGQAVCGIVHQGDAIMSFCARRTRAGLFRAIAPSCHSGTRHIGNIARLWGWSNRL